MVLWRGNAVANDDRVGSAPYLDSIALDKLPGVITHRSDAVRKKSVAKHARDTINISAVSTGKQSCIVKSGTVMH